MIKLLGKKLIYQRLKKRFPFRYACRTAKVSLVYMRSLERGLARNPSVEIINRVASIYNVDPRYLLDDSIAVEIDSIVDKIDSSRDVKLNRIRHYRKKLNMTVKSLSELSGLSEGWIYKIENDHHTNRNAATLLVLSQALKVNIGQLIESK